VDFIAYNAKARRADRVCNGVMTRYDTTPTLPAGAPCDAEIQPQAANSLTWKQTRGEPERLALQDFTYQYDLAGNITAIQDRTPESGIRNTALGTDALDRAFTYDPIYRLLSATGREYANCTGPYLG